jgi:hypothetical protein
MTQNNSPAESVLGLILGGGSLVMLSGPLSEYSTINLGFWGITAIIVSIVLAVLIVGTAVLRWDGVRHSMYVWLAGSKSMVSGVAGRRVMATAETWMVSGSVLGADGCEVLSSLAVGGHGGCLTSIWMGVSRGSGAAMTGVTRSLLTRLGPSLPMTPIRPVLGDSTNGVTGLVSR